MRSVLAGVLGLVLCVANVDAVEPVLRLDVWAQLGSSPSRNQATPIALPVAFDLATKRNVAWTAQLGSNTIGSPVVGEGKILVGTNNAQGRIARLDKEVELATLQCFDLSSGDFLWQFSSKRLAKPGAWDLPTFGLASTPCIAGNRAWCVTNRYEVVCLDLEGFRDGENDGLVKDEAEGKDEADVVWRFDMLDKLGVHALNQSASSVTVVGELVLLNTGNSVDESHRNIPAPDAPSFVALHRDTGRLVWSDSTPGQNLLSTFPASSPAVAEVGGVWQAIFAGADGWLYGFDLEEIRAGKTSLLWKFDCNPKRSRWESGGAGDRNTLVAMPVVYEERIYIPVGRSAEAGDGNGRLWCIDPTKRGDISPELVFNRTDRTRPIPHKRLLACDEDVGDFTRANSDSGAVWQFEAFDLNGDGKYQPQETMHRAIGSVALADGLAFVADISGFLHCLDARTGRLQWSHDCKASVWGTPLLAGGRVYVGDENGQLTVFKVDRKKQLLGENTVDQPLYGSFAVANNTLVIASRKTLIAIKDPNVRK